MFCIYNEPALQGVGPRPRRGCRKRRVLWRRTREAALKAGTGQLVEPRQAIVSKAMELETAKEILAEVFGARPGEVEEMIQRRLEERSWLEKSEEGL